MYISCNIVVIVKYFKHKCKNSVLYGESFMVRRYTYIDTYNRGSASILLSLDSYDNTISSESSQIFLLK